MLTTEQIEIASSLLRHAIKVGLCDEKWETTTAAFEAELERRKHGPYTLAEAVESGYIKRAGWGDDESYTGIYTGHGAITCFERAGSGSNSDRIFEAEDALASDYEPKPIDKPEEI